MCARACAYISSSRSTLLLLFFSRDSILLSFHSQIQLSPPVFSQEENEETVLEYCNISPAPDRSFVLARILAHGRKAKQMNKDKNQGSNMAREIKRDAIDADLRKPKWDQRTTRSGEVTIRWKLGLCRSRFYPLPSPPFFSFLDILTIYR